MLSFTQKCKIKRKNVDVAVAEEAESAQVIYFAAGAGGELEIKF